MYWAYMQKEWHRHDPLEGKAAPDFTVSTDNGEKFKLAAAQGKVVLLHFWATWCPPCTQEMPKVNALYNAMKDRPFELVAVSVDENKKDVDAFKGKMKLDFPIYFDPSENLTDTYGTFGLPESYLIDPSGKIVKKLVGPQNWMNPDFLKKIESLLPPS